MQEILDVGRIMARHQTIARGERRRPRWTRVMAITVSVILHGAVGLAFLVDNRPPALPNGPRIEGFEGRGVAVMLVPGNAAFAPSKPLGGPRLPATSAAGSALAQSEGDSIGTSETPSSAAPSPERGPAAATQDRLDATSLSDNISEFRRRVLEQIERNKRYPEMSGGNPPEGSVTVLFTLSRTGAVLGAWVKKSSGFAALDREAIATLLRSQPLPAIPPDRADRMNLTFDIDFSPGFVANQDEPNRNLNR